VSTRQLPEHLLRLEDEAAAGTATLVPAVLTVRDRQIGAHAAASVTETFPALVRTRLVYEGRPAFLAADPEEDPPSEARP
jgi:hypothetical protein